MTDEKPTTCPRRMHEFGPWKQEEGLDGFTISGSGNRSCTFCGSLHPDDFMLAVRLGNPILGPTDKPYKVYMEDHKKFYFQHLSEEQQKEFIDLLNAKVVTFGYPGYFYVLPFFIAKE